MNIRRYRRAREGNWSKTQNKNTIGYQSATVYYMRPPGSLPFDKGVHEIAVRSR